MTQDRRPPRRPTRPAPKKPEVLTGPIDVDTETSAALVLFAARHAALADQEKDARRVDKAAKAKDEAAAHVRKLEGDTKATAEQRAEAAAAYRAAVEAWERAKSGAPATADEAAAETAADGTHAEDTDAGDTDAGDTDASDTEARDSDTADAAPAPEAEAAATDAGDTEARETAAEEPTVADS